MQQVLYFYDGWTVGKPVALPSVIRPPVVARLAADWLAGCIFVQYRAGQGSTENIF